jgi:hypothetical protein
MIDFQAIKLRPLKERINKFGVQDIITLDKNSKWQEFEGLKTLASHIKEKRCILMMGAHSIKVGLSLYLIELLKKGFISHFAMNGAALIHDFEIAYHGATSEDVSVYLKDGSFGMWDETLRLINETVKHTEGGYATVISKLIADKGFAYRDYSVLYWCYKLHIPVTAHTAIGTEIIYQYPHCDGAALGRASYHDFKLFADSVSRLDGGVIVNLGSAVVMPEVFLKALSIVRNLGYKVDRFVSANLDMIDHYRTRVNVVERPISNGGVGINITGRHENTVPALLRLLEDAAS